MVSQVVSSSEFQVRASYPAYARASIISSYSRAAWREQIAKTMPCYLTLVFPRDVLTLSETPGCISLTFPWHFSDPSPPSLSTCSALCSQVFLALSRLRLAPCAETSGGIINKSSLGIYPYIERISKLTVALRPSHLQPFSHLLLIHYGILTTNQRRFRTALMSALVVRRMRVHIRHHRRLVMRWWGVAIQGVGIDVVQVIDSRVLDDGESAVQHVWPAVFGAVRRGGR